VSLDRFIWSLLQKATSIPGKGDSRASIQRREGELVLVFDTDNATAREILGISKCCDAVFLYMVSRSRPVLLFVELKGKDVATAAEQITSTMQAIRKIVNKTIYSDFPKSSDMRAVVVRSGPAPQDQSRIQSKFFGATEVRLQFARKPDLRDFLKASS
jgi:hypothetical protein